MMGKLYFKKIQTLIFLFLIGTVVNVHSAMAQSCVETITNPAAASASSVLKYGAPRSSGSVPRVHRGVDIMLEMCLLVQNQPGCTVIPFGNSPIWKTGGYGLYARYNCGPRVEVRYAHLNGWSNTGQPINGRSGAARPTPPHIHYEVLVDSVRVDPQCVWGVHPNQSDCPPGLGISPANMCDNSVLDALKSNALSRYTSKPGGLTSSMAVAAGRDPSSFGSGPFEVDLPECEESISEESSPGEEKSVEHEHDDVEDLEEGGNLPVLQPPTPIDTPDPPITPPSPDVPGTPGDSPNLTPLPASDIEPEELSGCATDTWTAMVNQAVMETRREDILNKRFIVKPDTVLDYSCFDLYVKKTADSAGPLFSETKTWANLPVDLIGKTVNIKRELGSKSLDGALMDVVQSVAIDYRRGQFNNPHLAGSTPVDSSAGETNCDVMAKVWKASKCKNFDDVAVFYTFEDLKTKEPREYPANMKCN